MSTIAKFEDVARRVNSGARLLRTWSLTGGVSAQITGLEIALPDGQVQKMIVRQYGDRDRISNLHIAADEFMDK